MGSAQSSQSAPLGASSQPPPTPSPPPTTSNEDKCPVSPEARAKWSIWGRPKNPITPSAPSHGEEEPPPVYNVYNQRIDPRNQMPPPQQEIAPDQRFPLPKSRVSSTIPKGGTESTWLYPSQQMFFNALQRKGKGEGVAEEDVEAIVSIHNNMNERSWKLVMEWEKMHASECGNPKLTRFLGRVNDLTPRARILSWFGKPLPFDRHDWYVDRCGKEIRYVIDFYYNEAESSKDRVPTLHSSSDVQSISMHARPALDSVGAFVDRARFAFHKFTEAVSGSRKNNSQQQQQQQDSSRSSEPRIIAAGPVSSAAAAQAAKDIQEINNKCGALLPPPDCKGPDCYQKTMVFRACVGSVVCPEAAREFSRVFSSKDSKEKDMVAAFDKMDACISAHAERSSKALNDAKQ